MSMGFGGAVDVSVAIVDPLLATRRGIFWQQITTLAQRMPRPMAVNAQSIYNMLQLSVGKYAFRIVTLVAPTLPPGAVYVDVDKIKPLNRDADGDMAVVFPAPHPPPMSRFHAWEARKDLCLHLRHRLLAYGQSDSEEEEEPPERAAGSDTGVSGSEACAERPHTAPGALKLFPPPKMSSKQYQLARRKWQPRWQRRREYWQRFICQTNSQRRRR